MIVLLPNMKYRRPPGPTHSTKWRPPIPLILSAFFCWVAFDYIYILVELITKCCKNNLAQLTGVDRSRVLSSYSNNSLVIIMGNLRGGEKAWKTLYENVLDPNHADLALIIGEPAENDTSSVAQPSYPNSTLFQRAKYVWYFPEYDDWADAIDLINETNWRKEVFPLLLSGRFKSSGLFGGVKGFKGSGAIIFMIRWFLAQNIKTNPELLSRYERFVITRSDHYYQCLHNFTQLDLQNNTIWIPDGYHWGGYTDRHLVVSRENVLSALDIFPTLLSQPSLFDPLPNRTSMNPEYVLKEVWTSKNLVVKTFPRVMFTCATANDTTRWRRANGSVPGVQGLLKKYPVEYTKAKANCLATRRKEHVVATLVNKTDVM